MPKEQLWQGVQLLSIAVVGLGLILFGLAGGLWAFGPDLEDGALPKNRQAFPDIAPVGVGSGMGGGGVRNVVPSEKTPEEAPAPPRPRIGILSTPKLPDPRTRFGPDEVPPIPGSGPPASVESKEPSKPEPSTDPTSKPETPK